MSEILEKILDKKNIDRAYQQICLREDTKAENARYFDENWDRIQEQIRQRSYTPLTPAASMTDRIIQQGIAQILSPSLRSRFFRTLLRLPARQKLRDGGLRTAAAARGGVSLGGGYWLAEFL